MSIGQSIASGLASGVAISATSALTSRLPPVGAKKVGAAAPAGFDPTADAIKQLGAIQAYMQAVVTPAGASADQLQAAQSAVGALAQDLIQIQAQQQNPPQQLPPGAYVSGKAALISTAGALAVGGIAGYFLGGRKKKEE